MKRQFGLYASCAAALIVAGCGSSPGTGGEAGADIELAKGAPAGWDATDACKLLDKADLGAALGDPVTETALGLVNQASGANAATSECTYTLASGGRATLMARNSPIADNTPEAMAVARKAMQETVSAFGKTVEDIPGLGLAASFVPGINQMNVYLDDKRFVILTISTAPNDRAKAMAADLIGKVKSTN